MPLERITVLCFGASYAVAFASEVAGLVHRRPWQWWIGVAFGTAGLIAHTLFLACRPLALSSPSVSVLCLAWILAVFYLVGTVRHRRLAWGLFVLPVLVGLSVLAGIDAPAPDSLSGFGSGLRGE